MSKNQKNLLRILVALTLFLAAYVTFRVVSAPRYAELIVYLAVYLLIAYDVLWSAARNIAHGRVFDENFLMTVASIGAFAVFDYPEAVAVLLFYQVGELFQRYAVGKSRRSVAALMDIRPDRARVIRDGVETTVAPEEVKPGEIVRVLAGERVPLDGVVVGGKTYLDTAALTGESVPRGCGVGDAILSGSLNVDGAIELRVEKEFYDSTVAKILDLVENAASKKAKSEAFITKFAKYYTPVVVGLAVLLAVVPSLVTGGWAEWVNRALVFLVVSCPCALVISVPMSFFGGIGGASKRGILIKGSSYLERLGAIETFVFDKTGTLTAGNFAVQSVSPAERRDEILRLAAIAETNSTHPIAVSIARAYSGVTENGYETEEVSGRGMIARKGDEVILAGSAGLLEENGVSFPADETFGTVVYVARNGEFVGSVVIADTVKEDASEVIAALRAEGCKTVMLTGDRAAAAAAVAECVGVDAYRAELLPADKVGAVEELMKESPRGLAFVGDGINDAPVLMRADLGVAMGGVGSDSAIEAADVVLMHDTLESIPLARRIARKTMRIVKENIVFALAVKAVILILSAFGYADMWLAVFADVGVAVLAILNAMRAMSVGGDSKRRAGQAADGGEIGLSAPLGD